MASRAHLGNGSSLKTPFQPRISELQDEFPGWRPFYLRRWVLALFLFAFCGIIGALEALKEVSRVNDGLASSVQSMRYTWTYGPVAILTIFAAVWTRVEFQAKQSAPWRHMCEEPATAEKSVLLEYVSPLQPVALVRAIKNQHYLAVAAIVCSILLRLLIVFSTGLFSLQEVPIGSHDVPIQMLDSLDSNRFQYNSSSFEPYDILNAVLFENLTYPEGTNKNLLFQRISAPGSSPDAIVNVTVDALAADLECESAKVAVKRLEIVSLHKAGTLWEKNVVEDIRLSTPSCAISNAELYGSNAYGSSARNLIFLYQRKKCDHSSGPNGDRIVMTFAKLHWTDESSPYNISFDNPGPIKKSWMTKRTASLGRSVQLICKPTLSRVKLQVAANATEPLAKARIRKMGSAKPLSTSMNWEVANATFSFHAVSSMSRPIDYMKPFNDVNATLDTTIKLGAYLAKSGTTGDIYNLFKDGLLYDVVGSYYRAISAQVMRTSMVEQKRSTTQGNIITNQNRVLMSTLSLRVVEICLVLGALLVALMIALLSRKAIAGIALAPWDPNTISAIAAMLPTSVGFCSLLRDASATRFNSLQECFQGHLFRTGFSSTGFSITITEGSQDVRPQDLKPEDPSWKPFPNRSMRWIILFMVALVIAALELVLYLSRTNDGLGTVSTDDYLHYLWTVLPSVVMVSIGLFFGSLDFNIRCLAPYARLKQAKGASFDESMSLDFLDALSITTVIRAIRTRNLAVLATTLTTLVSAFLTITTSGLYYAVDIPIQTTVNFTQESVFYNSSWSGPHSPPRVSGYGRENEGVVTADHILRNNVSFPRWTYDTLAFPKLSIDKKSTQDSFVDIRIPALRSALTCQLQSGAALNPNYSRVVFTNLGEPYIRYDLGVDLLTNTACAKNTKKTTMIGTQSNMDIVPHTYFGELLENSCGMYPSNHSTSYVWGYISNATDETPIRNIAALTCVDAPEFVETTTRFRLPSMDIDKDHPPVPDESTAKPSDKIYIPHFDMSALFPDPSAPLNPWFKALATGRYAIPVEDLGDANENDKVIKAIKHQHQLMRAQQFGAWLRLPANGSLDHEPILGNVTVSSRLRLVQDPVSTRILEALLGFMLVVGLVGSLILNTDGVLRRNPCSVVGVASLLADSNCLDRVTGDTIDQDGRPRERALFAPYRFFLGCLERDTEAKSVENLTIYMAGSEHLGFHLGFEGCTESPATGQERMKWNE